MNRLTAAAMALASLTMACAPLQSRLAAGELPASSERAERSVILALRADHNRAIAAGDIDGFMTIAAENYVAVFGGGTILRSRDELRANWTRRPQRCVRTPVRVEVGLVGGQTRAAEHGRWRCDEQNPASVYTGSYFAHWSKRSGAWRVVSDTYVSLDCHGPGCR